MGFYPLDHRLVVNADQACDPTIVDAIDTHSDSLLAHIVRIAVFLRLRRIFPSTRLTFPALTAGDIFPVFDLSIFGLAIGASVHPLILAHPLFLPHSWLCPVS
jgi:hypothetical protein